MSIEAALLVGIALASEVPARAADPVRGRALYVERCALCHGARGRGDGPAAAWLDPEPRDFVEAVYRIRSTETGTLPTPADIDRALVRGVPGTAMLAWSGLAPTDRADVVTYLISLSPRYADEGPGTLVPVPVPPPATPESVARGAVVFAKAGCPKCHGPDGRGDGPAARTLREDDGHRTDVPDFRGPARLKGGESPEDLYRTLSTGLDGTPMPSYAGAIPDDDLWVLVYFVLSLRDDRTP